MDKQCKPIISVIVPVYNANLYIRECVESILSQCFVNFELLLIDDGSTDGSEIICDEYSSNYSNVRVFHQENQGVCVARNLGIEKSKGDWFFFVDADDIVLRDALQLLYDSVTCQDADIAMGGSLCLINGEYKPLHSYRCKTSNKVLINTYGSTLWMYLFNAAIIKEHHIKFVNGLKYSEDQVFIAHYALKSNKIVHIDKPVYVYRITDTSVCAQKDGIMKAFQQFRAACELKRLLAYTSDNEIKKELKKRIKRVKRLGYLSYVANENISYETYKEYEASYLVFFKNRLSLISNTFIALINLKRSSVVSWSDNPIKGHVGLKSRLKKIIKLKVK